MRNNILFLVMCAGGFTALGSTVTLTWDSVEGCDYILYLGQGFRQYTNSILVGSGTTQTVSNLVIGSEYHFAVTARNRNGIESDYSSEVTYQVSSRPPPQSPIVIGHDNDLVYLTLSVQPMMTIQIEWSENLQEWFPLSVATPKGYSITFVDWLGYSKRFYRARQL